MGWSLLSTPQGCQAKRARVRFGGSTVRRFDGSVELIAQLPSRPIAGSHEGGR